MKAEDHPDYPRSLKLVRDFFERMIEELGEHTDVEPTGIRIDQSMFTAICVTEDDGEELETTVSICTSTRPHVQLGIAHSAANQIAKYDTE